MVVVLLGVYQLSPVTGLALPGRARCEVDGSGRGLGWAQGAVLARVALARRVCVPWGRVALRGVALEIAWGCKAWLHWA